MAKKHRLKLRKTAKKGRRIVEKHGPFAAALTAAGGFIGSLLASQKFRDGVEELMTSALARASSALGGVKSEVSRVLPTSNHEELGQVGAAEDNDQVRAEEVEARH